MAARSFNKRRWRNFVSAFLSLLLFSNFLFAKESSFASAEISKFVPKHWEYSIKGEGDFNQDGITDLALEVHQARHINQGVLVLFGRGAGEFRVASESMNALSLPDPGERGHSIDLQVNGNRLVISANALGSYSGEDFIFLFDGKGFVLSRYEMAKGNHCNNYTRTYNGFTDKIDPPLKLENFSLQTFYNHFRSTIILKDNLFMSVSALHDGLLHAWRNDHSLFREKVVRELVVFDDSGLRRCEPDDYVFMYLFLDDPTQVFVSNDIAFFFEQAGYYHEAIYLLESIVSRYPSRTVAYLNLGDAYWAAGMQDRSKKMYEVYVEQMKSSGKARQIPKMVTERLRAL